MMINKKYLNAIKNKDFYKFKSLINKDGQYIIDKIIETFNLTDIDLEIAYDLIVINLWNDIEANGLRESLDFYIESFSVGLIYNEKNIDDYKLELRTTDVLKDKILKIRKINLRNYRVLNKIIINDVKKELGLEEVFYQKVIDTVNEKYKYIDCYGDFGIKSTLTEYYFFVVLITKSKIYCKPLTIRYSIVDYDKPYINISFSDIKSVCFHKKFLTSKAKTMTINLNGDKQLTINYPLSKEVTKFKKDMKSLLIEKNIKVDDL